MSDAGRPRQRSGKKSSGPRTPRHRSDEAKGRHARIVAPVVKTTIWLIEDEVRALNIRALSEGRSSSSVAREAVRHFLGIRRRSP
jgi:hypothetical protein